MQHHHLQEALGIAARPALASLLPLETAGELHGRAIEESDGSAGHRVVVGREVSEALPRLIVGHPAPVFPQDVLGLLATEEAKVWKPTKAHLGASQLHALARLVVKVQWTETGLPVSSVAEFTAGKLEEIGGRLCREYL